MYLFPGKAATVNLTDGNPANDTYTVTLTGPKEDVNAAMLNFELKPGLDNGEDIFVSVVGTGVTTGTNYTLVDR